MIERQLSLSSTKFSTCRGLLFALVADKLDLFSAERRLEKEKCSFYCVLYNKSMYVMGLKDSNPSRQLSPTVHLPFYFNFWSLDLSLLHACFRGVLNYAMLLGKMKIISREEPFDHAITFLEVIGLYCFVFFLWRRTPLFRLELFASTVCWVLITNIIFWPAFLVRLP